MLFSRRKFLKIDSISLSASDPVFCTMFFRDVMLRRVYVRLPSTATSKKLRPAHLLTQRINHCILNFHGTDASYIQTLSPKRCFSVSRIHSGHPSGFSNFDRTPPLICADVPLRNYSLPLTLLTLRVGAEEAGL